jgi:hypothetical protein
MAKQRAYDIIVQTNTKDILTANRSLDGMISRTQKVSREAEREGKAMDGLRKRLGQLRTAYGHVHTGMNKLFGVMGVGFGLKTMISQAWDLNKTMIGMLNTLNRVSDASGDASKALSMQFRVWGKSLASLGQISAAMSSLGEAGMSVGPAMENLATWVSDMAQASGIGADKLAKLTGELHSYWGVSTQGAVEIAAAAVNTQKVFKTTTGQIEMMLGVIQKAQDGLGALFTDGEKGAKALAKGIAMSSGVLIKFGVNAQTATDFLDRMLDPEKFAESNTLLRMLGVSIEEQLKMMETAGGKELFFDKLIKNLPALSQKIQNITNPLMRLQYAKNLGLPPEIAAKLARAQSGEIGKIMQDYKKQQESDKQAEEKRKKAAANQERFNDMMLMFKLKVLAPMMRWTMEIFGRLAKTTLPLLATRLNKIVGGIVKVLDIVVPPLLDIADAFLGGDFAKVGESIEKFGDKVFPKIVDMLEKIVPFVGKIIGKYGPGIAKSLGGLMWSAFKAMPFWAKLGLLGAGLMKLNSTLMMMKFATGMGPGGVAPLLRGGGRLLGGIAGKAAAPLAAIAGGVGGYMDAEENFGVKKATGAQKFASTISGAQGLGIPALIDSLLGTKLQAAAAKQAYMQTPEGMAAFIEQEKELAITRATSNKQQQNELRKLARMDGDIFRNKLQYYKAEKDSQDKHFMERFAISTKINTTDLKRANQLNDQINSFSSRVSTMFKKLSVTIYNFVFPVISKFEELGIFITRMINGILRKIVENKALSVIFGEKLTPIKKMIDESDVNLKLREKFLEETQKGFSGYEKAYEKNDFAAIQKYRNQLVRTGGGGASAFGTSTLASVQWASEVARTNVFQENLLKANEAQAKAQEDANKTMGGVGRNLQAIRDTVARPEPPLRQDLVAAMIGTYGLTSWSFSI